jgi:DNA-binding MarR family transcriptional regulator/N-acetylglutamate synthase-like GNAT family acetyltransferase
MDNKQIEALRHSSRKLIRELGLLEISQENQGETPSNWHALIEISKDPGITISKLGHLLLMSNSKISRLVKNLEENKLLKLSKGSDKREKYLYLTNPGKLEVKKINNFSKEKISGSFEFLTDADVEQITKAINKYSNALEKNRLINEQIKVSTLSTSRLLRKQIINMIEKIQKNEFSIPVTDEINACILKAEQSFYYNNSYNFWYATNAQGEIIGSIGLKKINNRYAEIKKFFVIPKYRGRGVAQKLMQTLVNAAQKHHFNFLFLGTVDRLKAAQKFYTKYGFTQIKKSELPSQFEICHLDEVFFSGKMSEISR